MYIKLRSTKENLKKLRENIKIVEEGIKKLRRETVVKEDGSLSFTILIESVI